MGLLAHYFRGGSKRVLPLEKSDYSYYPEGMTSVFKRVRWVFFIAALLFLLKCVFFSATAWTVAGFVLCAGLWYLSALRKALELDRPKK